METAHKTRDLDLTNASRGVWLVKVPKYLSEKWKHSGPGEVGKLRINKSKIKGGKPEVMFTLDESLHGKDPASSSSKPIPKNHQFVLTGLANQSLSILSQEPIDDPEDYFNEKLSVEGKVIMRAECRPVVDQGYMSLKRTQLQDVNKPKREVVVLDKVVNSYKPIAAHSFTKEHEARKKEIGKRSRMDKDKVMDVLFNAFEKHQFYNVKDLVSITGQPITYLKEILKELCTYNMKAPHRNTWELKEEYRHYKK